MTHYWDPAGLTSQRIGFSVVAIKMFRTRHVSDVGHAWCARISQAPDEGSKRNRTCRRRAFRHLKSFSMHLRFRLTTPLLSEERTSTDCPVNTLERGSLRELMEHPGGLEGAQIVIDEDVDRALLQMPAVRSRSGSTPGARGEQHLSCRSTASGRGRAHCFSRPRTPTARAWRNSSDLETQAYNNRAMGWR